MKVNIFERLPWWLSSKESACQCRRHEFDPWAGKIPREGHDYPLKYSCLEEFHGQRSLVGKRVRHDLMAQFSSVQLLSHVRLFATPWTTARQASLSITNSQSPPKIMPIESVIPSNHLIVCHPLILLPSIFPSIRVFSNESALRIRWPKYWSFSFNISPSNEYSGLISFRMDWFDHLAFQGTL